MCNIVLIWQIFASSHFSGLYDLMPQIYFQVTLALILFTPDIKKIEMYSAAALVKGKPW